MKHILILFLLTTTLHQPTVFGQKKCDFEVDTLTILGNRNLSMFLEALRLDSFVIFSDKRNIPEFVKKQLDCYANGFAIANPDQPYQVTDVIVGEALPPRKLTFLAKSSSILIIGYDIGGMGVSSHIILVKYKNEAIVDLWKGGYSNGVKKIEDVIKYLLYYQEQNMRKYEDYVSF